MNSLAQNSKKLQALEEIKFTLVEHSFVSRWTLIEGYHKVGKIIDENKLSDLTQIASYAGKSKRTIYRCVQFYKKYPDLTLLPEGKNTSWNMVVTKYLSDGKEKKPRMFECPNCGINTEL